VVVGCRVSVEEWAGELGGLRGKSSDTSSKNHGGVGSASGSGEMTCRFASGEVRSITSAVGRRSRAN
jgi:hypothetical protein